MSVIGRLDDQVNEVLIKPLDRNKSVTNASEDESNASPEPPRAKPEAVEKRENRDELPVWLL